MFLMKCTSLSAYWPSVVTLPGCVPCCRELANRARTVGTAEHHVTHMDRDVSVVFFGSSPSINIFHRSVLLVLRWIIVGFGMNCASYRSSSNEHFADSRPHYYLTQIRFGVMLKTVKGKIFLPDICFFKCPVMLSLCCFFFCCCSVRILFTLLCRPESMSSDFSFCVHIYLSIIFILWLKQHLFPYEFF